MIKQVTLNRPPKFLHFPFMNVISRVYSILRFTRNSLDLHEMQGSILFSDDIYFTKGLTIIAVDYRKPHTFKMIAGYTLSQGPDFYVFLLFHVKKFLMKQ